MSNHRRPPENERDPGKVVPGKELVPVARINGSGDKVPAPKFPNFFANFLALTNAFDKQEKRYTDLVFEWRNRNLRVDLYREGMTPDYARNLWKQTHAGAAQCLADLEQLWAIKHKGCDIHHPQTEYLMWRIGEMLKAWPDARMSDEVAGDYAERMAERLDVEDLGVAVWESVFRQIEDERKKLPVIADVLPYINKHKTRWERRMVATDAKQIQCAGEQLVFALEFKQAVFKEAVLEYLDSHGYADLAADVRDGELSPWFTAIEATAKTEGLSELVAKMEANDFGHSDPFEDAHRILTNNQHVMLEWDLLLKNAQRRVNHDKEFVCTRCGTGYKKTESAKIHYCLVCDNCAAVVSHTEWDEQTTHEQEELRIELSREQQVVRDKLQWQREQEEEEARVWRLFEPYLGARSCA
jgi:hypothetical protein